MTSGLETRDYTAVFTLQMKEGLADDEWFAELALMQEQFDNQWGQTLDTDLAWTVTIHIEDHIRYEEGNDA